MRRVCLDMIHQLARQDPRVVFIASDPGPGTLDAMKAEFPDRFFIEGVSEANVIGMAAGLALEGYIPYVNTIATFLTRRCFEQVAIDACLHNLPIRLIANGGGLVYAPLGPTHTAIDDLALMRVLPRMTVVAPSDAEEMRRLMPQTLEWPGPIYIRFGKGGDPVVSRPEDGFAIGKAICLREPGQVLMVATGVMGARALGAADLLAAEGIACGVLNMHTLKPFDTQALAERAAKVRLIVTIEEHTSIGGLGSAVLEALAEVAHPPVLRLAIPDTFIQNYGSQDGLLRSLGLQPEGIAQAVRGALAKQGA